MRELGIILFGASIYDHHANLSNTRFAHSARAFQEIFSDPTIIEECDAKVLNLFDQQISPSDLTTQVSEFLSASNFHDVILYYCGHGHVPLGKKSFCVFLRTSRKEFTMTA